MHLPEEKKSHQVQGYPRNGSHCGPDYRLYKSEPELTTVAEVDESNGEEKSEPVSETEAPVVKGPHFPVGVPLRTKSPTPESSTIASYVTLRKTKKMVELRTERPRSAVEQLCLAESTRPRMTVEEQLERIRRHQQACLRERKKGLNIIGASELSPSQSPSDVRDSPPGAPQTLRRDDNTKDLDAVHREDDGKPDSEAPAVETAHLEEAEPPNADVGRKLKRTESIFYEMLYTPEPLNGATSEDMKAKERQKEQVPEDAVCSPQEEAAMANHQAEGPPEETESLHEEEETLASYEPAPEIPRENQTTVTSLSPSPDSSMAADPPTPPQLTEGSHFMCV